MATKHIATLVGFMTVAFISMQALAGSPEQATKIIDQFIASVEKNEALDDEQRQQLIKNVKEFQADEAARSLAITEGLTGLYPEFGKALGMMAEEDLTPAITALGQFVKSKDPYLATEASFYLAQAYSFAERYEDAIPLLQELIEKRGDTTVLTGNAQFLLGVSQANTLKRQDAIKTLTSFIDENPNASERMRIAAWRQVEAMKLMEEGTMADVFVRMDFSRRRLNLENSGKETQQQQDKIVSMLAQLIKQAEERECNCSSSGEGEQKKEGQGEKEGEGKGKQGGSSKNQNKKVVRRYDTGPQSPWSKLRNRQRDPAFSAIKEKYPARYQKLIEQYYESFNSEGGE